MASTILDAIDGLILSVADHLTHEGARRILDFQFDSDTHRRMDALAARAQEGQLTRDEEIEYEQFIELTDLIGILQAKARLR